MASTGRRGGLGPTLDGVLEEPTRVLVADDDATVAEVVARYLTREGFVVEVVGDGEAALERALSRPRTCSYLI